MRIWIIPHNLIDFYSDAIDIKTKPIGVNERYTVSKKGRKPILILSRKYRQAKEAIQLEMNSQWDQGVMSEPLEVYIEIPSGRSDIDAYIKIILDALQGVVYKNDRQVKKLSVEII